MKDCFFADGDGG